VKKFHPPQHLRTQQRYPSDLHAGSNLARRSSSEKFQNPESDPGGMQNRRRRYHSANAACQDEEVICCITTAAIDGLAH
jgi:hypothetical protein